MKRLLIVEDEKMIRQGLRVMIQRAPVEVEEILDCANGEEALALLRKTPVDVLFTDVRMPKMDGISLIQKLDELPHPPLTVVISGYDEFSYAVEALRCGAKDYLLKPVSREDISRVLCALEEQVQKRGRQMESCHLLKYVLLNPDATQHEWEAARAMFHSLVGEGDFWAVATRRLGAFERPLVCMEKMGRPGCLYLLAEEDCLPEEVPEAVYCGISGPHKGFDAFPLACRQAREAWFSAFFTGSSQRRWKDLGTQCACFFTKETAQRLALLLGTE